MFSLFASHFQTDRSVNTQHFLSFSPFPSFYNTATAVFTIHITARWLRLRLKRRWRNRISMIKWRSERERACLEEGMAARCAAPYSSSSPCRLCRRAASPPGSFLAEETRQFPSSSPHPAYDEASSVVSFPASNTKNGLSEGLFIGAFFCLHLTRSHSPPVSKVKTSAAALEGGE